MNSSPLSNQNDDSTPESQARQEIEAFVKALASYPESFEDNPRLTFEQHLVAVAGQTR
ncbi:MAG TPA: hypothetical protein VGF06_10610 [Terriglobales bacterium]|jgi:hypothetical protein